MVEIANAKYSMGCTAASSPVKCQPANYAANDTATIRSLVHLDGPSGRAEYLPLCAKSSFLALLEKNDGLLEEYIRHALVESNGADIVIFIADGEVMETALRAMGKVSAERARIVTAEISKKIRSKADNAIARIGCARVRGVLHWSDVASCPRFQAVFTALEDIMTTGSFENEAIQVDVKTLVKNLFTQRVEKARAAGSALTNVFIGEGLELKPNKRYHKRYNHLERSCLLELSVIISGLTSNIGERFTEMRYLTTDPRGMSFIAECVEHIRRSAVEDLIPTASTIGLKTAAAETHGITFAMPSL